MDFTVCSLLFAIVWCGSGSHTCRQEDSCAASRLVLTLNTVHIVALTPISLTSPLQAVNVMASWAAQRPPRWGNWTSGARLAMQSNGGVDLWLKEETVLFLISTASVRLLGQTPTTKETFWNMWWFPNSSRFPEIKESYVFGLFCIFLCINNCSMDIKTKYFYCTASMHICWCKYGHILSFTKTKILN